MTRQEELDAIADAVAEGRVRHISYAEADEARIAREHREHDARIRGMARIRLTSSSNTTRRMF